jgi:glyoxylase-like metal-dependent hydrolase (beta-lactamase superfamily II)
MDKQIPLDRSVEAELDDHHAVKEIAPDIAYKRLVMVNVVYMGVPEAMDGHWVLIDAGLPGSAGAIEKGASNRFGTKGPPAAIIMTHGHFDHVGALETLAERWGAPVFAHPREMPYLDGRESYPPPDPTVGGGLMSALSAFYPRGPVDVSSYLQALPPDGSVPFLPEWRWIPTPGHAPGHISLWRERDHAMVVGDAFITTNQESAYGVATQVPELHGPPKYFTPDWDSARESVRRLAALEPDLVITGHGHAMHGPVMLNALKLLARDFDRIAVPEHGRYVHTHVRTDARDGGSNLSDTR